MSPRPYRLGQRQAAIDETRARVIAAARKLLVSADPGRFSIDAVAQQADVARATVYYQFHSKLGLLEALFDSLGASGGLAGQADAFGMPDPLAALDAYVAVFGRFWGAERTLHHRLRGLAALDPDLETALNARQEWRRHGITVLVDRLASQPPIPGAPDSSLPADPVAVGHPGMAAAQPAAPAAAPAPAAPGRSFSADPASVGHPGMAAAQPAAPAAAPARAAPGRSFSGDPALAGRPTAEASEHAAPAGRPAATAGPPAGRAVGPAGRAAPAGQVRAEVIDMIFAVTSFETFDALAGTGRTPEQVIPLVQHLARSATDLLRA